MSHKLSYPLFTHHSTKSHVMDQKYTYEVERHAIHSADLKEIRVMQFGR